MSNSFFAAKKFLAISAIAFVALASMGFMSTAFALTFGGSPAITVSADPAQPPAGTITMGSTGNILAIYRVTETSNIENVKINSLTIFASSTSSVSPFENVTLWNGSTLLGTSDAPSGVAGGFDYEFPSFATPVIVPQGGSISLTLKGDTASFASLPQAVNTQFSFLINSTSSITGIGATSNETATINSVAGASGNEITITSGVTPATYTIVASAEPGGTISPSGQISVQSGSNQTFTINADPGYDLGGKVVDGVQLGGQVVGPDSYTFTNVTADHTIVENFFLSALATVTVTPATSSISAGTTEQLTALTRDQAGLPFSTTVTWSSSNTKVATVNTKGLVTAISPGVATITAASGTVATVTLIPAVVTVTAASSTPVSSGQSCTDKNNNSNDNKKNQQRDEKDHYRSFGRGR